MRRLLLALGGSGVVLCSCYGRVVWVMAQSPAMNSSSSTRCGNDEAECRE